MKITILLTLFWGTALCVYSAEISTVSKSWISVNIPASWNQVSDTNRYGDVKAEQLNIDNGTGEILINIQRWTPPIRNPESDYADQMLEQFNQMGAARFSGTKADSTWRFVGTKKVRAYCLNVVARAGEAEKKMKWETYKLANTNTEVFIIVAYPESIEGDEIHTIDSILESISFK